MGTPIDRLGALTTSLEFLIEEIGCAEPYTVDGLAKSLHDITVSMTEAMRHPIVKPRAFTAVSPKELDKERAGLRADLASIRARMTRASGNMTDWLANHDIMRSEVLTWVDDIEARLDHDPQPITIVRPPTLTVLGCSGDGALIAIWRQPPPITLTPRQIPERLPDKGGNRADPRLLAITRRAAITLHLAAGRDPKRWSREHLDDLLTDVFQFYGIEANAEHHAREARDWLLSHPKAVAIA